MRNILILGLNPSSRNTDPATPFKGTKTGKMLKKWLKIVMPEDKEYLIMKRNLVEDVISSDSKSVKRKDLDRNMKKFRLYLRRRKPDMIIALGNKVHNYLITHLMGEFPLLFLPHPSPRNRKLNNKEDIELHLLITKATINYIWEKY